LAILRKRPKVESHRSDFNVWPVSLRLACIVIIVSFDIVGSVQVVVTTPPKKKTKGQQKYRSVHVTSTTVQALIAWVFEISH